MAPKDVQLLNTHHYTDLAASELDSRLAAEELESRLEMWCSTYCAVQVGGSCWVGYCSPHCWVYFP